VVGGWDILSHNSRSRAHFTHTHTHTHHLVHLGDPEIKTGWETVPLTVSVSDTCDPNALTSIEVFSDEAPLNVKHEYSAVLGRTYANTGAATPLSGWTLTLSRKYAKKHAEVNTHVATFGTNGRFYTVRVCATDLAGNIGCDEAAIAVPPMHAGAAKAKVVPVPINNGKLYKVASDLVYWGQAQNDIPFRLKNTGLNM
jgi:ribosomal protein L28